METRALERSGALSFCQTYPAGARANIFARMGLLSFVADRLTNVMSGLGTTIDRRTSAAYVFNPLTPDQAEAAYRTSWLARKIVDVPALDMTREGRDWQADDKQIELIEKEEERLQLWQKLKRAVILSRAHGGGVIVIGDGSPDPMQPLDVEKIGKGGLRYLRVLAPQQLALGPQIHDPESEWVDRPQYFEIYRGPGQQWLRLHPSRVVEFIGQKALEGSYYQNANGLWFWGDPILQSIGEAIKNADLAQNGFASLIDEAKLDILAMPDLTEISSTAEGERKIIARLSATMLGKSTWRALLIDKEDEWQQRQITWAGIPEIMDSFLNVVAGAADIPVTRLLGQSPKGLQSTGDGEERDYHSMIRAQQDEMLAPALARIDELLIRSALGSRPPEIFYTFAPLSELSEKDAAAVDKSTAETLKIYCDTGLVHEEALAEIARNKMIETGRFPGCEAAFDAVNNELGSKSETPEEKEERVASEQTAAAELLEAGGVQEQPAFGSKKKALAANDYNPYHVASGEHGGRFTTGPKAASAEDPDDEAQIVRLSPVLKRAELIDPNAGKSVEELRAEAIVNQEALEKLGRDLEAKTGIDFQPPPPGFGVKTMASLQRKIQDEGYAGAHEITDISRASFIVESPQEAQAVLNALAEHGRIYDKGWSKLEEFGYGDRKLYLRHANDGVSEIQIVPKAIAQLKLNEGHKLYEIARVKSTPVDVVRAAKRKSRTLYNRALRASPFRSIFAKADS